MNEAEHHLKIDPSLEKPYVLQIQDQLRGKIKQRVLRPGERIPSFRAISRECGVSIGTVKQAINTLTTEGYLRSHPGRGVFVAEPQLKRKHVALVLPTLELEPMGMILRGVKAGLASGSRRLIVQAADLDFDQELDLFENLDSSFVAGAIIYPPPLTSFVEPLRALRDRGVPFVLVNTCFDELDVDAVVPDSAAIGRMAMRHLLERGHRKIGLVDHTADAASNQRVRLGMAEELTKAGLDFATLPRVRTSASDLNDRDPWANGREAATRLMQAHDDLTAMLGINENISMGVLQAVKAGGHRVPTDISVMAIGELNAFDVSEPGLSCIRIPHEAMGHAAATRLSEIMADDAPVAPAPRRTELAPELVERGSVDSLD